LIDFKNRERRKRKKEEKKGRKKKILDNSQDQRSNYVVSDLTGKNFHHKNEEKHQFHFVQLNFQVVLIQVD